MKQTLGTRHSVAVWLALISLMSAGNGAFALGVGEAIPSVKLATQTATIDLAKLKGKLIYVDFWASWCGPCKQSFPWMNEMHAKYAARGLEIIAINLDAKAADAERFLATTPVSFTVAFDARGDTPKQFGVKAMPSSYLIDGDGKITLVHSGFREADRAVLESAITTALTQQDKARK